MSYQKITTCRLHYLAGIAARQIFIKSTVFYLKDTLQTFTFQNNMFRIYFFLKGAEAVGVSAP